MQDGAGYTEAGGFAEVIEITVDRVRLFQRLGERVTHRGSLWLDYRLPLTLMTPASCS